MPVDQDWTAVYPSAAPFRPNAVPLPVRMGYPVKGGVPPGKKGNLELIKVRSHYHHMKRSGNNFHRSMHAVSEKKVLEAKSPFHPRKMNQHLLYDLMLAVVSAVVANLGLVVFFLCSIM